MRTWSGWSSFSTWRASLGVNIAGIAIILQMRERMEEMNHQMQDFVNYVRTEMLTKMQQGMPAQRRRPGRAAAAGGRPVAHPRKR